MRIEIREANRQDAEAISCLIVVVARTHIAAEFPQEGQDVLLKGMTSQAIGKYLLQGYRYYLAYDDDRLCGVIGMRGYSHIYHLFVPDDLHGHGIGRQLWDRASQASLAEIPLSEFTVYSSRYAEAFYQTLGFRRCGNEQTRKGVTAIPMRLMISDMDT